MLKSLRILFLSAVICGIGSQRGAADGPLHHGLLIVKKNGAQVKVGQQVLATLRRDETVFYDKKEGDWFQVRVEDRKTKEGKIGWIHESAVIVASPQQLMDELERLAAKMEELGRDENRANEEIVDVLADIVSIQWQLLLFAKADKAEFENDVRKDFAGTLELLADQWERRQRYNDAAFLRFLLHGVVRDLYGDHWKTTDAGLEYERVEKLSSMSERDRQRISEADEANDRIRALLDEAKHEHAIELIQHNLEVYGALLGKKHRATAQALLQMAIAHEALGELKAARQECERGFAIRKEVLGANHPEAIDAAFQLDGLYARMIEHFLDAGDLSAAIDIARRQVALLEETVGPEGWQVSVPRLVLDRLRTIQALPESQRRKVDAAIRQNRLTEELLEQRQYSKALEHSQSALDEYMQACPEPDYAVTATYLDMIAALSRITGNPDAATTHFQKSLEIASDSLGAEHPETALHCRQLADTLRATGRLGEALGYYERAEAILQKALGGDSVETIRTVSELAALLESMVQQHLRAGELTRASEALGKLLPRQEYLFGNDHWRVTDTRARLSSVRRQMALKPDELIKVTAAHKIEADSVRLFLQGKPGESLERAKTALETRTRVLGKDDFETAESLELVGSLMLSSGDNDSGRPLLEESLRIGTAALAESHPARHRLSHNVEMSRSKKLQDSPVSSAGPLNPTQSSARNAPRLVAQVGHLDQVSYAAYSSDGSRILTGGRDGVTILWDAESGREIRRYVGSQKEGVSTTFFSPGGGFVITTETAFPLSETARLWNADTGTLVRELAGKKGWFSSTVEPMDGSWEISGNDQWIVSLEGLLPKEAIVSDLLTGKETHRLGIPDTFVRAMALSRDGRFLATGHWIIGVRRPTIAIWELKTGLLVRQLHPLVDAVTALAFAPDGLQLLSCDTDFQLHLWDLATGQTIRTFFGNDAEIGSATFSSDGRFVLAASEQDAVLWDAAQGIPLRRFPGRRAIATLASFSPAGRYVITAAEGEESGKGQTEVWETATGKLIRRFELSLKSAPIQFARQFSPDDRWILKGKSANTVVLCDFITDEEVRRFASFRDVGQSVAWVGFSRDGQRVVTRNTSVNPASKALFDFLDDLRRDAQLLRGIPTNQLWNAPTYASANPGKETFLRQFALSPNGEIAASIASSDESDAISVWHTVSGREFRRLTLSDQADESDVTALCFLPDGRRLVSAGTDNIGRIWDIETGTPTCRLEGHEEPVVCVTFGDDGKIVATGSADRTVRIWNAENGGEIHRLVHESAVVQTSFVSRGTSIVTLSSDGTIAFWDATTGRRLRSSKLDEPASLGLFVSALDAYATWKKAPELARDLGPEEAAKQLGLTEREVRSLEQIASRPKEFAKQEQISEADAATLSLIFSKPYLMSGLMPFSHDGRFLITTTSTNISSDSEAGAVLWDTETGKRVRSFVGHADQVTCAAFSPDDRLALTGSFDGTAKLWDVQSAKELCTLLVLNDGGWAAVAPDGRFDTSDLDQVSSLHWVMPDDPHPLPLEVFMRDYFEPRLIGRILQGEPSTTTESLVSINRVQPAISIRSITPGADNRDEVTVTVDVADQSREFDRAGRKETLQSGVYDVRLFRDGRLVGYHPDREGPVKLDADGKARIEFGHIKLPCKKGIDEVEFSAYAFNMDRVKSETHRVKHKLPELSPRKGVAYLVCVGVNAFDSPSWDLKCAVPDAEVIAKTVSEGLANSREFSRVMTVSLLAAAERRNDKRLFTDRGATKDNIRRVFAALAKGTVDEKLVKSVPSVAQLKKARPEDLVLISLSTHGYNGDDGQFYLFPSDIGEGHDQGVTKELLNRAISTDELTEWLRDVDAGEMVMIVDACHSAATVEQEGFKPGPMGSRGLGQLAYNKRMRVLAASQAADVAFEDKRIGHGLLTYALARNGLDQKKADFEPPDQKITLGEWLRYGVKRVPELSDEIALGKLRAVSLTGRNLRSDEKKGDDRGLSLHRIWAAAQTPALFDFAKGRDEIVLQSH